MALRILIFLFLFLFFTETDLESSTEPTHLSESGLRLASKTKVRKKTSTKAKKTSKKKTRTKSSRKKYTKKSTPKKEFPKEDPSLRLFTLCGDSTACLVTESIVFAPIFPWFLYPFDTPVTRYQSKRFNGPSGVLDFALMKANNSYSGYKAGVGFYIKWVGLEGIYDTYNNGEFDQNFYSVYFVLRPFPRKHIQPKLLIGWKYIKTDKVSGGGFNISFFNYDIAFTRRFWMHLINYIGWVKGYTLVEGFLGFEYYVYPTISIKTSMDLRHVASEYLYGFNVGLSIKI
jgi:hypothetical protein